ncbi:hypothetical protein [Roseibium sediminicola]|uniref:Secreted protein n=1 Tax=Roseibium sediminicola TaxID=2933272 RepID=A0ABT0H317_9HYPH|nr:hypothetical protein [Roseibium sp. CAU 1639]MCK7615855.1 hypothetical protein [Roseibium sp. CAU 1639]
MLKKRIVRRSVSAVVAAGFALATVWPVQAAVLPTGLSVLSGLPQTDLSQRLYRIQYNETTSEPSHSSTSDGIGDERDPRLSESYGLSDRVTRGVAWLISNGASECKDTLRPEYRIDCLRIALSRAASTIDNRPNYRQAARDLRSLSRKLEGIVNKYQDRGAPRATKGRTSYRAVSKANQAQANREAAAAIDETVTKLLRSAGNSEKRKVHYSQIATAVGSTKRLLRS